MAVAILGAGPLLAARVGAAPHPAAGHGDPVSAMVLERADAADLDLVRRCLEDVDVLLGRALETAREGRLRPVTDLFAGGNQGRSGQENGDGKDRRRPHGGPPWRSA